MPARSTPDRYGRTAILLHWTSAVAVILTFAIGYTVADILPEPAPAAPLFLHIGFGIVVLLLTLFRIFWWLLVDRHPVAPAGQPNWQVRTSQVVHVGLYVLLLLMVSSGVATLIASGAVPLMIESGQVPDFAGLIPRVAHGLMSRLLLLLFVVHVGAALYHQFVRRDRLLARMGIGSA